MKDSLLLHGQVKKIIEDKISLNNERTSNENSGSKVHRKELASSKRILEENPERILRICFEWNVCRNPKIVRHTAELAFVKRGNVKFDMKCFTPAMSLALIGVSNERSDENFRMVAEEFYGERRDLQVLTAITLLVPGYVDFLEVESTAKFIAELDPDIPCRLLIFHPNFAMSDEFTVRVAKTLDEACKLVEAGFDYVADMESEKSDV